MTVSAQAQLRLTPRRGRTVAVLALGVAATVLLAWVLTQPNAGLGVNDFYVAIFPLLAIASAYRLVRPRVPFAADDLGIRIDTGLPFLGLKTFIAWEDIKRLRINARNLLLVELRNPNRWPETKSWRVRANMRASRRKFNADAVVALNELIAPAGGVAAALREMGRVRVEAV